jgi:predicted phosphohydrolase
MDVFGELWRDHARRMAESWDATVQAQDVVLLAGDLSWARTLAEARVDLEWIGQRPGRKVLLRGNHDSWWTSQAKVTAALPSDCAAVHHNALRIDDWVLVGARGWTLPDDPAATAHDVAVYERELARLRLSIEDADRKFGRELPRLAMTHYPPRTAGNPPSDVVRVLREAGVSAVVYGHLHGSDHARAVRGELDGIRYHFVAADAVDFAPVPIDPPRPRA